MPGSSRAPDGSWVRLATESEFDHYVGHGGVIVNVDPATDAASDGPKAHAWGCPYLTKENFLVRQSPGGYFWARDMECQGGVRGAEVSCFAGPSQRVSGYGEPGADELA